MRRAIFLDRDGVINKDIGFCHRIEDFIFTGNAIEALKLAYDAGYALTVITNQSGIGRGYYSEQDMHQVHNHMTDVLCSSGIKIDTIKYCPHSPEEACACRKPSPYMILKAADELDIDPKQSYMVGDKTSDILAGRDAGCRTVFITSGFDKTLKHGTVSDLTAQDLYDAVRQILQEGSRP